MTVTREPKLQRHRREIAVRQSLQRRPQTKLREIPVHRHTRLLLKYAREVKRRDMNGASNVVERDAFTHSCRQVRLHGFSSLGVIRVRAFALRLARLDAALDER